MLWKALDGKYCKIINIHFILETGWVNVSFSWQDRETGSHSDKDRKWFFFCLSNFLLFVIFCQTLKSLWFSFKVCQLHRRSCEDLSSLVPEAHVWDGVWLLLLLLLLYYYYWRKPQTRCSKGSSILHFLRKHFKIKVFVLLNNSGLTPLKVLLRTLFNEQL